MWEFEDNVYYNTWRAPSSTPINIAGHNMVISPDASTASAFWRFSSGNGGDGARLLATTSGNYYTFNIQENGYANSYMAVLETPYNPKTIISLTDAPAPYGARTATVTLSAAPSTGEYVYIRYTTDNYVSSTIIPVTFVGNVGTALVPVPSNPAIVKYYAYSSNRTKAEIEASVSSNNSQVPHDMLTLELSNEFSNTFTNQVIVTSTGGSTLMNTYATIQAAFSAINGGVNHTGSITIALIGNTTETATAALNASGSGLASYTSVGIQPAGGTGRTISGSLASPLVNLNGADNVTIDGREGGLGISKSLTISNTSTSATASTIQLNNDASNNVFQYCTVLGSNTSLTGAPSGTINITSGITTGNDNNNFNNNDIGDASGGLPSYCIYSYTGDFTAYSNDNNTVDNNNIYNYFTNTDGSGIYLKAVGSATSNSSWSITNNRIYQTATRTGISASRTYSAIRIGNSSLNVCGSGFTITGNVIGYANNLGTGTTIYGPSTPDKGYRFIGIQLFVQSANINGNTVAGIEVNTTSGIPTTPPGVFAGISIEAGNVNAGIVSGNTIGAASGTGSIKINSNILTSGYGISITSTGTVNVQNNTIGSINAANTTTTAATNFYGVYKSAGAGTTTITNNTIGSSITANSIIATSLSTTNEQVVYGINSAGSGNNTISGNIIANITNSTTNAGTTNRGLINGIVTSAGINTITNNTIHDLTISNANNANTNVASVGGIVQSSSVAGQTLSGNVVYNLSNKNTVATFAGSVIGLYYSGSATGTNVVSKNYIHDLSVNATSILANIYGIKINTGSGTYSNNIVNLGGNTQTTLYGIYETGVAGNSNNLYFNTVYISGSPSAGALSSYALYSSVATLIRDFRNNIFCNVRSRTGGTSVQYAAYFNYGATPPTLNYNNYYAPAPESFLGRYNGANLSSLPLISGQDANSKNVNPGFVAPPSILTDFIPTAYLPGLSNLGNILDDIDGTTRCLPTMGAQENITDVGTPSTPTPSAASICQGSANTTYTASATNASSYNWSVTGTGNSISGIGTTGTVTWAAGYSGTATVSVTANGCSGPSAVSSTTVTVRPTPTSTISGTTAVCQNATAPVVTFTNPHSLPVTVTYNINGANQTTVNIAANSTATVTAPTTTAGVYAYNLVSVVYQTAPTCSNNLTGTATITINAKPTTSAIYHQ